VIARPWLMVKARADTAGSIRTKGGLRSVWCDLRAPQPSRRRWARIRRSGV